MSKVPVKETKRDKELIADYQAKEGGKYVMSTTDLTIKYRISSTRVYQILDYYNVSRRSVREKGSYDRPKNARKGRAR